MKVVADTTPLRYLIEVGAINLVRTYYGSVLIPPEVHRELQQEHFPEEVKAWAADLPEWVEVVKPENQELPDIESAPGLRDKLHDGEKEAFRLALEVKADRVLVDDRDAISYWRGLMDGGLADGRDTRTLTILGVAKADGLDPDGSFMLRLPRTRFRMTVDVLKGSFFSEEKMERRVNEEIDFLADRLEQEEGLQDQRQGPNHQQQRKRRR